MKDNALRQLIANTTDLETPSFVWEDSTNARTYIAYSQVKGAIKTDSVFKIKLVVEDSTNKMIDLYEALSLLPICIGVINPVNIQTTLTDYYNAGLFKIV